MPCPSHVCMTWTCTAIADEAAAAEAAATAEVTAAHERKSKRRKMKHDKKRILNLGFILSISQPPPRTYPRHTPRTRRTGYSPECPWTWLACADWCCGLRFYVFRQTRAVKANLPRRRRRGRLVTPPRPPDPGAWSLAAAAGPILTACSFIVEVLFYCSTVVIILSSRR